MYSQRSKKHTYFQRKPQAKGSYSRKPTTAKQSLHRAKHKQRLALEEDLLNESSYDANKPTENVAWRSLSREPRFIPSPYLQKKSEEEIKSISIDGIEDLSIIKSRQQPTLTAASGLKNSVLICDEGSDEDEDLPLFALDISNEELNYTMLQHEYEKLIRRSDCQESESGGKLLNMSSLSLEKSKRSDQGLNHSLRKEVVLEKFEEILRVLPRYVSMRAAETPQTNSSINLSRESKRLTTNNLFEINEEWEHSEIIHKEEKKLAKEHSNIEFTLNQINKGELDEHSLKKETLANEYEPQRIQQRHDEKLALACDTIKNFWRAYRQAKKNSRVNRYEQYRRLMVEHTHAEEEKVDEYFPTDEQKGKPGGQDNFNQLLSQLSNESDHEAALAEMLDEKGALSKKISELSMEDKKKPQEMIALDNMGSISAIKSGEKLRHLSEHEDEEEEADQSDPPRLHIQRSSNTLSMDEVIERREAWIEECTSSGLKTEDWRRRELQLLRMLQVLSLNPTAQLDRDCLEFDSPIDYASIKHL